MTIRRSNTFTIAVLLLIFLGLSTQATLAQSVEKPGSLELTHARLGDYKDPARKILESPELWRDLQDRSIPLKGLLDRVFTVNHRIPVAPGQEMFVTEHFTLRSILRWPHRAAIFLTGPEFRGNFWSIPVEGYNGPEMAAKRGFFAFTLDYIGVGESYMPPDGSQINYMTQVEPVRRVIDLVRLFRGVSRVDLIGEGYGVEVASELADEPQRVRSVVASVAVYRQLAPGIASFFSPQFEAFLRNQPNGYYEPSFLDLTLLDSPNQELRDYVFETQPGIYPTGPGLQFFDLPFPIINAAAAEVPGLVIMGELDPFPAPGDSEQLAAEWGGGAELVTIRGAKHVPRIESEEVAAEFFDAIFAFIDP